MNVALPIQIVELGGSAAPIIEEQRRGKAVNNVCPAFPPTRIALEQVYVAMSIDDVVKLSLPLVTIVK